MLDRDGYLIVGKIFSSRRMEEVAVHLDNLSLTGAGTRNLLRFSWCQELAQELREHPHPAMLLPADSVAIQAILFEKSVQRNWLVPFHQDIHIPVGQRVDHPQLSGWSEKEGAWHVRPPVAFLEQLLGVRVHADDCSMDHGPLRVVPGSHQRGRLSDEDISMFRQRNGERSCLANKGDIVVMRPLLLHASSKAAQPNGRRVIHFLFGPKKLPFGLTYPSTV